MGVFAAIFLAFIVTSAAVSWAERGEGNQRGNWLAVAYAAKAMEQTEEGIRLQSGGRLSQLAAKNPSLWLIVVDQDRVFTRDPLPQEALRAAKHLDTILESTTIHLPGFDGPTGNGYAAREFLSGKPVVIAAGGVDPATLTTLESLHLLFDPMVPLMLAIIALVSLFAMAAAIPFLTRAVKPLSEAAAAIGPHDPGIRIAETVAPRELLPVIRGFNGALDRLEVELGRQRRFIANAAHELRTPLAVVSLGVDALSDGADKVSLQRSVGRLTSLVSQMLSLARLSLSGQEHTRVDLVGLARDVVAELAPLALSEGYDLALEAPEFPVVVKGDPDAVGRAMINLIGNSIAHGSGAGQITVRISPDGIFEVADEGPGVPPALHSRLFEPFSRGRQDTEGSGLGLHLTREIMNAHDGEVSLVPSPTGAKFRLKFRLRYERD